MSEIKIGFGAINDQDESLQGAGGGSVKFGLNKGFITKLEFNPNAGKDNTPGNAIDLTVTIGDREMMTRIFDVTKVFANGGEITDVNSQAYIKGYNDTMRQNMAVVIHALKALGITQEKIQQALATPPEDFVGWAQVVTSLAPANYQTLPVDVFLEYQWNLRDGQDRTFLQLPRNMKGGYFLIAHIAPNGSWTEQTEWVENINNSSVAKKGLRYVDNNGMVHPFVRSENFMESPKAVQQVSGPQVSMTTASTAGSQSTW